MADGTVIEQGRQVIRFIYEGEALALEYPDGQLAPIPPRNVNMALFDAVLPSGEPCKVVMSKSPITRLDIVELPEGYKSK